MPNWMDPEFILHALGNWALWGCALIIFAECGIFAILPGDSLLFTIGMFIALGSINLTGDPVTTLLIACSVLTVAAVAGNAVGYQLGRLIGPPLFKPRDGLAGKLFDPKHVARTHDFIERYGPRALVLARFVPIVRTFVTLIAGVAQMTFRTFIAYTAVGGVLWAFGVTIGGYFLGTVPLIHNNIDLALVLIVAVSLVPMGVEYLIQRRKNAALESAS
ncbi:MAG: VTT domain-containing protein [Arachnia sp.]